jgi:hypothetical protein
MAEPWAWIAAALAALACAAAGWMLADARGPGAAWRNRGISAALVAACLLASRGWIPDAESRAFWQYLFTITLGYGHLIGAWWFAAARRRDARPAPDAAALRRTFVLSSVLTLFAAYTWALNQVELLFIPLLAVSVWHTAENDLGLARAYRAGLRLGPLPRAPRHHLLALSVSALLILTAAMTPLWLPYTERIRATPAGELAVVALRGLCIAVGGWLALRGPRLAGAVLVIGGLAVSKDLGARVTFADLFVGSTLYHLFSWLVFFADRARAAERAEAAALWRRIGWVHLPPALLCGALLLPAAEGLAALRFALFSPGIYLFWSVLHVAQTAWARGFERRPAAA